MKRFMIFGGSDYYPLAGFLSYIDSGDSVEECHTLLQKAKDEDATVGATLEWWQFVDKDTGEIVESHGKPYDGFDNFLSHKIYKDGKFRCRLLDVEGQDYIDELVELHSENLR